MISILPLGPLMRLRGKDVSIFAINENSSKQLVDDNQNELENTIQIESKETDHTSENEPLF